jgi:hypothetical protein
VSAGALYCGSYWRICRSACQCCRPGVRGKVCHSVGHTARSAQVTCISIGESVCRRRGPLLKKVKTSMKMGSGADEVHLACGSLSKP